MKASKVVSLLFLIILSLFVVNTRPVRAAANSWTSKTSMQEARGYLGVAVVNGKIYAIGGDTKSGQGPNYSGGTVGTNEEYDPATDTWAFKKPMPTPRAYFATAVYQNKIYCIGETKDYPGFSRPIITGVNEVYDPATDTWETKEPLPALALWPIQANVVNGKIYVVDWGGMNYVYDPAADSWTTKTKAPMPVGCEGFPSAVLDNKIYFVGGDSLNQIYDTETDTWSLGAPSPSSVLYGAAGVTTGVNAPKRIYYIIEGVPYSNQVYNPENDSWTIGADLPTIRKGFGVAVVNDVLYVIGGQTWDFPFDVYFTQFYIIYTEYAVNEQYTPIGYGTVPPAVAVVSPENKTYDVSIVPLTFAINKLASWMGYSLDGQDNVTITGNTTLAGLSNGLHNLTVYAKDAVENVRASETVYFTIAPPSEPFPATWILAATAIIVIAVMAVAGYIFLKRKK